MIILRKKLRYVLRKFTENVFNICHMILDSTLVATATTIVWVLLLSLACRYILVLKTA